MDLASEEYLEHLNEQKRKIREAWLKLDKEIRNDLAFVYFSKERRLLRGIAKYITSIVKSKEFIEFLRFFHETGEYPHIVNKLHLFDLDKNKISKKWLREIYGYIVEIIAIIDEEIAILDFVFTARGANKKEREIIDFAEKEIKPKLESLFSVKLDDVIMLNQRDFIDLELRDLKRKLINIQRGKRVPLANRILYKFFYWINRRAREKNKRPFLGVGGVNMPTTGADFITVDYSRIRVSVLRTIKHELMHSVARKLNPLFKEFLHTSGYDRGTKYHLISEGFAVWGSLFLFPVQNFAERVEIKEHELIIIGIKIGRKISLGRGSDVMNEAYFLAADFFKRVYDVFGLNHIIYIIKNPDAVTKEEILNPTAYIIRVKRPSK